MGNVTSTITIRLYERSGDQTEQHFTLNIKEETYPHVKDINKITYKISYNTKKHYYNIVIEHEKDKTPFFTYSSSSADQNKVNEVNSYCLKTEKLRPLIIGFKTEDKEYNYRFHDLQYARSSKTLDISRIEYVSDRFLKNTLEREVEIIKLETNLTDKFKQGYGCIYLSNKGDQKKDYGVKLASGVKCNISVTREPFEKCKYVQCVKYKILYSGDTHYSTWDNTWYRWSNWYYYLYFYTGSSVDNPGIHMFTYYPRRYYETITEVHAYCSSLYINQPFFITMKTIGGVLYHSSFDDLFRRRTAYNYELRSTFQHHVNKMVNEAYEEMFKKVLIKNGKNSHVNIKSRHYLFDGTSRSGTPNKYKKFILIAQKSKYSTKERTIFINSLLSVNPFKESCENLSKKPRLSKPGKITNKPIDPKTFNGLSETEHEGVVICYSHPSEIALSVEIYSDRNTRHQFVRQDLDGDNWIKRNFEYHSDFSLAAELDKLDSEIGKRITYFLENNSNYNDNKVTVSPEYQPSHEYTIYTHLPTQFGWLISTKVLYNCKNIDIVINSNINKKEDRLDNLSNFVLGEANMYVINSKKDDHLIMNLIQNNRKSYCLHRYDKEGTKWRQISLAEVLELNLISSELFGIIGPNIESEDLGSRINKVLKNPDNCKRMLENISHSINSIIVILDNRNMYGKTFINQLTKDGKEIPPIDVNTNNVTPDDTASLSCSKIPGYTIYKHDLTEATTKAIEKADKNQLYIRLHSESRKIILYEDEDQSPFTCLTYDRECSDLYVYFKKDGTKPLMFYYNRKAYGPKEKGNKWFRIKEITDCKLTGPLIRNLDKISKFVNEKQQKNTHGRGTSSAPSGGRGGRGGLMTSQGTLVRSDTISTTLNTQGTTIHRVSGSGLTQHTENQAGVRPQSSGDRRTTTPVSHNTRSNVPKETIGSYSFSGPKNSGLTEHQSVGDPQTIDNHHGSNRDDSNNVSENSQNHSDDSDKSSSNTITYAAAGGGGGVGLIGTGLSFCKHIYVDRKDFSETPSSDFYRLYPGNEVRLFYTYWIKCTKVVKNGDVVEKIICEYDPKTKGGKPEDPTRKVKATIHWMSKEDFYPATFRWYSRLFTKPDPKEGTEGELGWLENLNKESLKVYKGFVEKKATELKVGDPIQFERTGYFTKDPDSTESEHVFNLTITLVDAFANKESLLHKETEKKKRLEAIAARQAKKSVK